MTDATGLRLAEQLADLNPAARLAEQLADLNPAARLAEQLAPT